MNYKQTLIIAGIAGLIAGLGSLLANIGTFGMEDVYRTLAITLITGLIEALTQFKKTTENEVIVKVSREKRTKLFLGQK
jgi:hypothetical protein